MTAESGYKKYFGLNLAELLSEKLLTVYPKFNSKSFLKEIKLGGIADLELKARVELIADKLRKFLPKSYPKALEILLKIYGPENQNETGMFTFGYWLWPVAKFIEKYGLDNFDTSVEAIAEITKRHTGEYAIRPYIVQQPGKTAKIMRKWANSSNVHLRRLASEGIRPRLPWAQKLTIFLQKPQPVFAILEALKDDKSKFVQKSVANNINDYLKDNEKAALKLLKKWEQNPSPERKWIIKHALRNQKQS